MKFLVDRCAVRRLAAWLQDQGHDVHVAWEHVPDPGDAVLLEMAAQEGRVLVTIDTDFATPVYLHNAAHAGIVRLPDVPSDARIALMEEVLARMVTILPEPSSPFVAAAFAFLAVPAVNNRGTRPCRSNGC